MADDAVKVGGPYVENEDFVPNPADQNAQYNTSGLGAHQRIEEVSSVYEVDKVRTAQQVLAALDPKDASVSADKVLLPEATDDNETAKKSLAAAAKERVKQGVVIGEPGPAEREAAEETDPAARAEGQAEGKSPRPAANAKKDEKEGSSEAAKPTTGGAK